MRTIRVSLGRCLPLAAAFAAAASALAAPGDVKRTFESPCKYPTGLATDGKHFFVVDWREAQIHEISADDGTPERTLPAPTLKPSGLAYGDGRLFVADDLAGWVFVLNLETGLVERSFEAPGPRPTGLAYAADGLFILERKTGQIYKVLHKDGTILTYIPAPNDTCTNLGFDGRYLWVSDRIRNEIYMVNPADGLVLGILDAPGPYATGLAPRGEHLWCADFQTRKLYELVLHDTQKYRLKDPRSERLEFMWAIYNYGPSELRDVRCSFALPQSEPYQELLSDVNFATTPTRVDPDRWGQRCAIYELPAVAPADRPLFSYTVDVRLSTIRYLIFPNETGTLADIPADLLKTYTADDTRYRIDSPFIKETVKTVVGDEQCPYWIARKIYNYLIDKLEYEMTGGWDVPETVLKRGKGSCSEYTFAFIALCRAAGLPTRYRGSVAVRGDDASVDDVFHRWAEVYLPNYGWIMFDPSGGDHKLPADQARGIAELPNRFLVTTQGGGDSEYLEWNYNSFATYKTTGYTKVQEENLGYWEPLSPSSAPADKAEAPRLPTCKQP